MLNRRLCAALATLLVGAFLASRVPATFAAQPLQRNQDLTGLLDSGKPLTDAQVKRFVAAGTPALDAVLDDFARSPFLRTARKVAPGDPMGRAFDRSTYASNVVRVVEAFGLAGVDRSVRRLDPATVKAYSLDSREFRRLGPATIKPLLTAKVIESTEKQDMGRVTDWIKENFVWEEVQEINPGGPVENTFATAVAAGVVAGLVVIAVEKAYDHFVKKEHDLMKQNVAKVKAQSMKQMLSPAARQGALLKELDPKQTLGNPAQGF